MAFSLNSQMIVGGLATLGLIMAAVRTRKRNTKIASGVAAAAAAVWTYKSYSTATAGKGASAPAPVLTAAQANQAAMEGKPDAGGPPPQGAWDKVRGWMPGVGTSQSVKTGGFI